MLATCFSTAPVVNRPAPHRDRGVGRPSSALKPGTDAALANGLLHVLIRDNLVDDDVRPRPDRGLRGRAPVAMAYWPERVEQITGIAEARDRRDRACARRAPSAMILTARGPEQQAQGVTNALAYINVALAIGAVGKPHSGFGTLTGQGNGQGGREHGQKTDQLPGYRLIDDPAARRHIAGIWDIAGARCRRCAGKSAFELLDALGTEIRALLVMGSTRRSRRPMRCTSASACASLDTLVVADFFLSETAQHADIVLPSAQWAEEDGTMTNLEGRVILRRRAMRAARRGPHRPRNPLGDRRARSAAAGRFPSADAASGLRRAAARPAGRPGRLLRHHLRPDRRRRRRVLALPGRRSSRARRGCLPIASRRRPAGRAFTRRRMPRSPTRATPTIRCSSPPAGFSQHYQSGTQTRRVAELLAAAPEPFAEMHPLTARLGRRRRRRAASR